MSSFLDQVITGRVVRPRGTMLYGTHGVGKTFAASKWPAPVFLPTEDGSLDLDVARFPLLGEYRQFLEALGSVINGEHKFETVVVDSLDWLERLVWQDVCKQNGVDNIEKVGGGYGKGYSFALTQWRQVLDGLDKLKARGVAVVLIAHSKIERFQDPEHDTYDRYSPRLQKLASALIQEWCDEVLFASWKVFTRESDEGFGGKKTRGVGTGERMMRCVEQPSHVAKNRLGLPAELPLDYDEYAQFLPQ